MIAWLPTADTRNRIAGWVKGGLYFLLMYVAVTASMQDGF